MTKTQLYIIIIIVTLFGLGWLGFSESGDGSSNLPESIGDPLELVVVKNNNDFDDNLYSKLKESGAKEIYFQRITNGPHSVRHERITQQMLNFFDKYLHNDKTVIVDDSEFSLN